MRPPPLCHIVLDNPPVNGLGAEMRQWLLAQVDTALADTSVAGRICCGDTAKDWARCLVRESPEALLARTARHRQLSLSYEDALSPERDTFLALVHSEETNQARAAFAAR